MDMHNFTNDFSQERKIVRIIALAELVAFLLGGSAAIIAWRTLRLLTLGIAILALIALAYLGLFLFLRFTSLPVVKEKQKITVQMGELQRDIRRTKANIKKAIRTRETIDRDKENKLTRRQAIHNKFLADLSSRREAISTSERKEFSETLRHIQNEYFSEGLRRTLIIDGKIQGVGPKMKERLASHGIRSVADISVAGVSRVPGFGEAKTSAVVSWRRSIERHLEGTKPTQIPPDRADEIIQKYAQQIESVNGEAENAAKKLETDFIDIKQHAIDRHTANDQAEVNAREHLEDLVPQVEVLTSKLEPYAEITLINYLKSCLPPAEARPTPQQTLMIGGISLIIAMGFCWQATLALGSVRHIYIASLPTLTPSATITPTATYTYTPTFTLTPSITLSPTFTLTPTITQTSTITSTPTITLTPTVTIPSNSSTKCIPNETKREVGKVTRIVDGDTFYARMEGYTYSVRLIGIDAPEGSQRYANHARDKITELLSGKTVTLVMDISETDQYNRLLRYVLVEDTFVNYELVKLGLADAVRYPPDIACASTFETAEATAKRQVVGIWSPTPIPWRPTATGEPGKPSNCHPSYPTVCIPPPPPDLDCGDISYRRFQVVGSDPHRFDGDHDGIGCESG